MELARWVEKKLSGVIDISDIRAELAFLRHIDSQQEFYSEPVVKRAIFRYQTCWLPLIQEVSQDPETDLQYSPPIDVRWVWHVHMLAPEAYRRDLEASSLGRIMGHRILDPASKQEAEQQERARLVWERLFPSEPFSHKEPGASAPPTTGTATFSYDILAASKRQEAFYYQVSLPHFTDNAEFLRSCIRRYSMYLALQTLHPEQFLVPCYDIDIAWHTHQVNPVGYQISCLSILGRELNHDDSVNDRAPGTKLTNSSQVTSQLWAKAFRCDFRQPGAMYRGPSPRGKLLSLSKELQQGFLLSNTASVVLTNIRAIDGGEDNPEKLQLGGYIKQRWSKKSKLNQEHHLTKIPGTAKGEGVWEFSGEKESFRVEEHAQPALCFSMENWRPGTCCLCIPMTMHGYVFFAEQPLHPIPASPTSTRIDNLGGTWVGGGLSFQLNYTNTKREACSQVLGVEPGAFYDTIIPETVSSLWGPIPLERLPEGMDNACRAVTHRIVKGDGDSGLSIYLIHSVPLVLSAVQVFVGSKMAVVSHSVGSSTIGWEPGLSLDKEYSGLPWRAMLIKDDEGDVGICVAAWKGLKRPVPSIPRTSYRPAVRGQPGEPGYCVFTYLDLRTGEKKRFRLPDFCEGFRFELDGLEVDFDSGEIAVKKTEEQLVQKICLAFTMSTLYLLVQPRPEDVDQFEIKWRSIRRQNPSARMPLFLRNASLAFLLYSGWKERQAIPSNATLAHERKKDTSHRMYPYFWLAGCGGFYSYGNGGLSNDNGGDVVLEPGDVDSGGGWDGGSNGGDFDLNGGGDWDLGGDGDWDFGGGDGSWEVDVVGGNDDLGMFGGCGGGDFGGGGWTGGNDGGGLWGGGDSGGGDGGGWSGGGCGGIQSGGGGGGDGGGGGGCGGGGCGG